MSAPVTWVALLGVAAVLCLAGPFNTDQTLGLVQRLFYWIAVVSLTYGAGSLLNGLIRRWLDGRATTIVVMVAGLATAFGVSLIVFVANWIVFDYVPGPAEWLPFFGTVFAISMIVNVVLVYIGLSAAFAKPQAAVPPRIALLDRLPLEKRGPLVALSVEDHYVRVQTLNGQEMILMRLSDAIREVGPTDGAQVHRSHWVAFGQVTSAKRSGDRAILTLSTGGEIPVSRANLPKIKEAGLLPK